MTALSKVRPGTKRKVQTSWLTDDQLHELGLNYGDEVIVVSSLFGSVICRVGGRRVTIPREWAREILV